MTNILNNILSSFFPKTCIGCSEKLMHQETHVCTKCFHKLPFTNFHEHQQNPAYNTFYGRIILENATALLHYKKKGIVQQLLHHLKYKGQEEIGTFLGTLLGNQLKDIPSYKNISYVIPVPLHKKRLRARGYNQVAKFAQQLALHLEATYTDTVLQKTTHTKTQAFKNRTDRWLTIQNSFEVTDYEILKNQHILLVDDVITTGATLEACANALQKTPNIKISIATMSIAS